MYEFASLLHYEDELASDALLPQLDESGAFRPSPGERLLLEFSATSLTLYRDKVQPDKRFLEIPKTDVKVTLTDRRVVLLCEKYTKGGGYVGYGGIGMAVAATSNAVSKARAARRREGKVLAGQMWLRWIYQLAIIERGGFGTVNAVRIAAEDAEAGGFVIAYMPLAKNTPSRPIGERILAAAVTDAHDRRETLDEVALASLDGPPAIPTLAKGAVAAVTLPFAVPASAASAPFQAVAAEILAQPE